MERIAGMHRARSIRLITSAGVQVVELLPRLKPLLVALAALIVATGSG